MVAAVRTHFELLVGPPTRKPKTAWFLSKTWLVAARSLICDNDLERQTDLAALRFDDHLQRRDVAQRGNLALQRNRIVQERLDRMPQHDPADDAKTLPQ